MIYYFSAIEVKSKMMNHYKELVNVVNLPRNIYAALVEEANEEHYKVDVLRTRLKNNFLTKLLCYVGDSENGLAGAKNLWFYHDNYVCPNKYISSSENYI